MAAPQPTAKQPVNLASSGPRVSRIRRDPPPAVKEKFVDPEEREQWAVTVGVLVFALAIFVIVIAFGSYSAWSPRESTIAVTTAE